MTRPIVDQICDTGFGLRAHIKREGLQKAPWKDANDSCLGVRAHGAATSKSNFRQLYLDVAHHRRFDR
jgi:transposase-like protein